MKSLASIIDLETPHLTVMRLNAKEDHLLADTENRLRKAGFKHKGFGSNEHWDNGDIIVCLNGDSATWIEDGISTDLSICQLHFKLSTI